MSTRGVTLTSTVKANVREKGRPPLHVIHLGSMKEPQLNTADRPINNNNIELPEYIVDPTTRTTYLKGKFLGKGGFARVHELTDLTTNKVYAGKIIPKSRITKPYHKEKIAREIELHRTLKHEHVVGFHHFFEDEENVYIILENCSRKSLVHILKYRRTLTEPEVRYYMNQLALGVQYVHSESVIHRDLKLGNMFLTEDLVMKIGDFGLATRVEQDGQRKITICGTPNYIAPEVLNKHGHGFEADLWAMGCIMYAMLVGQPPFETTTLKETYTRITTNKYVIPPLISGPARSLIAALLHPDPRGRPNLATILKHDFFTCGYLPTSLPTASCTVPPKFPVAKPMTKCDDLSPMSEPAHSNPITQELRKLTRTMSQLCVQGTKLDSKSNLKVEKSSKALISKSQSRKDVSLPNTIRQKLSSVLCSDKSLSKKTKFLSASSLYQLLSTCLDAMPEDLATSPPQVNGIAILFVTKWIDYSNKYGFGFQLSDRSVGVLFNDSTKMSFIPDRSNLCERPETATSWLDKQWQIQSQNILSCRIEFHDNGGQVTMHSASTVPSILQDRYTLLKYFAKYMDENLTEGGDIQPIDLPKRTGAIPQMRRWIRTPKAIVMQLSSGTVQVNFFKDHTKIILSEEQHECLVTYINENRQSVTFRLLQLVQCGCPSFLYQRLLGVLSMLRDFAHLESSEV